MAALADAVDTIAKLEAELTEARAQIAALAARHEKALVEGAARLAERDEARAQIAAKDAKLDALYNERHLFLIDKARQAQAAQIDVTEGALKEAQDEREWAKAELAEARAQIAAKDAALLKIRDNLSNAHAADLWRIANLALAAPARETE